MDRDFDIEATYSDGVLRPDEPLAVPDNTRVRVTVHDSSTNGHSGPVRIDPDPRQAKQARELWQTLTTRGVARLNGWHPSRDEMHERG